MKVNVAAAALAMAVALAKGAAADSAGLGAKIRSAQERVRALQARKSSIEALAQGVAEGDSKTWTYPKLETTDHEFFKKDYPSDGRPNIKNHFSHPYPEIQDSNDFDDDYVKDENHDNGHYDAQMAYDRLRTLRRSEEAKFRDTAQRAAREAEAAREGAGAHGAGKAGSGGKKSEAGNGGAGKNEGSDPAGAVGGKTPDEAQRDVEKATKTLVKCKSGIEEALKTLAELMDEKAKIEEGKAVAAAKMAPLKKKVETFDKKVDVLRSELQTRQKHHAELVKDLDSSKADLRKEEDKLKKALAKVRKFRKEGLDRNSKIYDNIPKSGAAPAASHAAAALALLLSLWVRELLA